MITPADISAFLLQVKTSLDSGNYRILAQRFKYTQTLSRLGIIEQDVIEDIKNLTVNENWSKQPDNNPVFPGDVWICKKNLHGKCIYIKLKIKETENDLLLIMSYHIDGM